ncbi:GNAT family N-acetyltransferase [Mycoplasmatota bacterium]|nr:GNAT family N-acetyltransferase [Mycoplasmatota bacterium]
MIEFKNLLQFTEYQALRNCWNQEVGYIFPISENLFESSVINNKDLLKKGSYVALHQNEVVGFILAKTWKDSFQLGPYKNIGWISLFYVRNKFRNQGIGSKLLELVEEAFKIENKQHIVLGRETFNFFPGLPVDFVNHRKWFIKRGYELGEASYDMIRDLKQIKEKLPMPATPYEIRVSNISDKEKIIDFFERCFPGRWEFEAKNYFSSGGQGREFVIALDSDKVIGFARINDQQSPQILYNINWSSRFDNLGGVGPLGVDRDYRKQKLGYMVTAYAVNEAIDRGCTTCIIDWTGLVNFYHIFKFDVWKSYDKFEKKIN